MYRMASSCMVSNRKLFVRPQCSVESEREIGGCATIRRAMKRSKSTVAQPHHPKPHVGPQFVGQHVNRPLFWDEVRSLLSEISQFCQLRPRAKSLHEAGRQPQLLSCYLQRGRGVGARKGASCQIGVLTRTRYIFWAQNSFVGRLLTFIRYRANLVSKYYTKCSIWKYFGLCLLKTCFSSKGERI